VKYMILVYGSQQDYDGLGWAGRCPASPTWSAEDFAAMGAFMEEFSKELAGSGELVETRGLTAPVHARRASLEHGVRSSHDGPYAETQEVLAGYWIVECESFDRASEIAARLGGLPWPLGFRWIAPRTARRSGRTADRRLPERAGALTVHDRP